jgi:glycosyltransferase involved in cell wall biosynthesis
MMFQASVVIPAYNEAESAGETVRAVREVLTGSGIEGEIILVDDGSTDGTAAIAEEAGAVVISHGENLGYGVALKTGIRHSQSETIVITDADGTYPVDRIPDLLKRMEDTGADMVVGARTGSSVRIPLSRKPFKWFLRRLARYIVKRPIPDLNSGLRVFSKKMALRYMHLYPKGFSFTSTITVASMCDDLKVEYVPIDYHERTGKSKIVPVDFLSFVILVLRLSVLFKPLRVFIPVSAFCFTVGFLKMIHDVYMALLISHNTSTSLLYLPVISATAIAFFLASLQILLIGMVAEALARKSFGGNSVIGSN